jgi:hypothetical protein
MTGTNNPDDNGDNDPEAQKDVPGGIPTVDGAVRQLEKAALAADKRTIPAHGEDLGAQRKGAEVVALGKDTGGAPEDAVTDVAEN